MAEGGSLWLCTKESRRMGCVRGDGWGRAQTRGICLSRSALGLAACSLERLRGRRRGQWELGPTIRVS